MALYAKINVFRYPGNILRYPEVSQKYLAGILEPIYTYIYIYIYIYISAKRQVVRYPGCFGPAQTIILGVIDYLLSDNKQAF